MDTSVSQTTAIPTFLVSNAMFSQPRFPVQGVVFDGSSLMYPQTTSVKIIPKSAECGSITSGEDHMLARVPKGRRPKSMQTPPSLNPNQGLCPDRPMCRACGKHFMSRQQLNQHMLVHTDVRKYKCSYCERSFKQPSHLHQHHRIHTGEKPYKCPIPGCSRAFPQQSNLNHHLRNHDKPAPPPENTCTLCMRTYASETVLRSHITKIHLCNPDTLLGPQANAKHINNDQKPFLGDTVNQDNGMPSLKRMRSSYSGNSNIDLILNECNVSFPVKYEQAQFQYAVSHRSEIPSQPQNFQNSLQGGTYPVPTPASIKQEHIHVPPRDAGARNVLGSSCYRNDSKQLDGFSDSRNVENGTIESGRIQDKFTYRYHYNTDGLSSAVQQELESNESGLNGNIDNNLGIKIEINQCDSNESSNNSDSVGHKFEHSPPDVSNPGRSRKRKSFQPQRIVQNKQPSDLDEGSENM